MEYLKEIVHYCRDYDSGIGLDLDPACKSAVIASGIKKIDELFASLSGNVTFVTEDCQPYLGLKEKYSGLTLKEGNVLSTNLENRSVDFIVIDSSVINCDWKLLRNELKRISSSDGNCDILLIEEGNPQFITEEFLEYLYAGSWYEMKEFGDNDQLIKVYHNPIGFNEEELKAKEITEFLSACEDYCKTIENFDRYKVKDFLYNVQKTLTRYYLKGFDLPKCPGSNGNTTISDKATSKDVNLFFEIQNKLETFIGSHDVYWSNFDPYPEDEDEDEDKKTYSHSLSCDLAEIYEDIKGNLEGYNLGNLCDKQEMLWQFIFDWQGHTGDHLTFAVRAIHWKLQEMQYED